MKRETTSRRLVRGLLCFAPLVAATARAQSGKADPVRIQRDIATLADDRWEGRGTCTPGLDSAAAYIARRFAQLKLDPAGSVDATTGKIGFFHRYAASPSGAAHYGLPERCQTQNVAGVVRGTDPRLRNEFVIIGAHYDHLGWRSYNALDPHSADSLHNGADDNASGSAAVMELARLFSEKPAKRSIVFVTFSGEEWGLLGSKAFVASGMPAGRAQAMVNFDMVGRLKNNRLLVFGVGTATELREIVERQNSTDPFVLGLSPDGYGPSDHDSFYEKGMPVLHFFTDTHEDYHKASDDASKINAPGEARVVDYAARVARDIADRAPLTLIAQDRPKPKAVAGSSAAYLGSIPDMAAAETPGLRVTGVTPGSPGDKGGLKAGDLIIEFGGAKVVDIQSYSDALYSHKPGDTVQIVVMRAKERVVLTVTLGVRGG